MRVSTRARSGRSLVLLPLGLIIVVCVVDVLAPPDVHLGPLLVAAPALTAAFAGPRLTGLIGGLAVAAQVFIGIARGVLLTANLEAQIASLIVVSALIAAFCLVRDRREHQLSQSRAVAQSVQDVLFPPLPRRSGPLCMASLYVAAQDEATVGGDLYAAARTGHSTRLLIADVRGKGLPAISHAALLLGAFRAASHRRPTLPRLAAHLDGALRWDSLQWDAKDTLDIQEAFATALILDIPDDEPVLRLVTCGHPPPVLLGGGSARLLACEPVAPPLGLGVLPGTADLAAYHVASFPFAHGDALLLYTDGVMEARDQDGAFFPLLARAAAWPSVSPEHLLRRLRGDLIAHTGGGLADDAAAVAVTRAP
ncbi:PP2C family protein-serine/threonine phosphatase [Streptomyces sp. NPDC046985]|uniref:PP2C family protein-serine/threonine phosphatase n=1 Tax=Streptomyces sp. NPDC046985 TaxID=3155377 RepID=UPI0033F8DAD4